MSLERRHVRFIGRVQGVGFRYTAARLAPGFGVSGFVRNEQDGSVVLEAMGEPDRIREFLNAIRGEFGSKIYQADESTITTVFIDEPGGSFEIRY